MADHAQSHGESPAHDAHEGATVRTYVQIFVVLFVITAVEVAASWLSDYGVPQWIEVATLIILSILKGLLVVMFYMHLRFDSAWFRFLFISAMILATFGVGIFLVLFAYHRGIVT